jgi:hypothetical protein
MATPFLQAAFPPLRREGAQTMVECSAFILCPIVPLIYFDHASQLGFRSDGLTDFEAHAEALQPRREGPAEPSGQEASSSA